MSDKEKISDKKKTVFSEDTTDLVIFYAHGARVSAEIGAIEYAHGFIQVLPGGTATRVSVEKDDVTGRLTVRIDKVKP